MSQTAQSRTNVSVHAVRSNRADTEYSRRAEFHSPQRSQAFNFDLPAVPAHAFRAELLRTLDRSTPAGWLDLDQSHALGTAYPATTPTMLARYGILRARGTLPGTLLTGSEIVYVMSGEGCTMIRSQRIDWCAGDVLSLPGGQETVHHAGPGGARLFVCNDSPALHFLGIEAARIDADAVHYRAEDIEREMGMVMGRPAGAQSWPVQLTRQSLRATHAVTPTLTAGFNPLEPGQRQAPHRHNAAAITLSLQGTGYSSIGNARIEWEPFLVTVTPPWLPHAHYNTGSEYMMNFTVQDAGLHFYARTMNFTPLAE